MHSGVYKIINLVTGRVYYGSTAGLRGFPRRWSVHKYQLNNKINTNAKLQNGWNKYGQDNFKFEIVEECPPEQCIKREQWYLDNNVRWGFDYNVRRIAESNIGNTKPNSVPTLVKKYGNVISLSAACYRIHDLGWDLHKACSVPARDRTNSFKSLLRKHGNLISYTGAMYRIKKLGWDKNKAASTPLQKVGRRKVLV